MKTYAWRGEPVDSMTREQLLVVVAELIDESERWWTPEAMEIRSLGRLEKLRRQAAPK